MKISYNWLKQFINIDWDAEKTGELLTDLGLEIEGIDAYQSVKGGLEGVVVGEVLTCEQHPNADRSEMWAIKQEFWDKIGINNYSNKQRVFTNKISTIADRIIGQKEREMIPDLIEKCVEWAMDNKIDKPTQAILRGFLAEDNINLTPNNFKILHTKVTIELKSSK